MDQFLGHFYFLGQKKWAKTIMWTKFVHKLGGHFVD